MDFDVVTIRENVNLEMVLSNLRKIKKLPDHTDKLFVVKWKKYNHRNSATRETYRQSGQYSCKRYYV